MTTHHQLEITRPIDRLRPMVPSTAYRIKPGSVRLLVLRFDVLHVVGSGELHVPFRREGIVQIKLRPEPVKPDHVLVGKGSVVVMTPVQRGPLLGQTN